MRRFKNNILKDKKFMREVAIILIVGIIVNSLCFLFGTIYSKAATPTPFPYYCYNDTYNTAIMPYIDGVVQSVKDKWYGIGDDPFVIVMGEVWLKDPGNGDEPYWALEGYVFWEVEFNDIMGESFASRDYSFLSNSSGNCHRFDMWLDSYRIYSYDNRISGDFHMLGDQTIHNIDIGTYTWGYPIYCSEPIQTRVGAKNFTVIANSEASDPNGDLIGSISSLPGIDNILNGITSSYNNTALQQFPSYDGSLSIGENIENYMDWLGNSINNGFNNLGSSISGFFNNLSSNFQSWLNSINNNIYNGFKNFTDNLSSFFKPYLDNFKDTFAQIKEKLDYITEPFSQEEITDYIEDSDIYNDISTIQTSVFSFGTSFTGVSEPDDYTLTFHIEDIDILNQSDPFVLHLNILNPVKSTIRAFLWVIVSYGLFISVVDSLPNYINGGGGEDD